MSYRLVKFLQSPRILLIKNLHRRNVCTVRNPILRLVKDKFCSLGTLKENILCLSHLLLQQCQVYTSQQLRHVLQLYFFYSRIWGEEVAQHIFSSIRHSIFRKSKSMLLPAACLLTYDWEQNCISDNKIQEARKEFASVDRLCSETIICECCQRRQAIDQKINGIDYCNCKGDTTSTDQSRQYEHWQPFLERDNILVWRKKHDKYPQLYCYKVYGSYDDVTSAAFMEVQLDTNSRTQWDSTALNLTVLNSDPKTNSDLIYWTVKFPQFFSNRDYVYLRRFQVNEAKKEIVIVSEVTNDAGFPQVKGLHRVHEYWSMMVIRAKEDFHKPGMSYTLTYFDNPGMSLPAAVTNYVASTGFPTFLQRVYTRAMEVQSKWEKGEDVYLALPDNLKFPHKRLKDLGEKQVTIPSEEIIAIPQLEEQDLAPSQEVMSQITISKFIKNLIKGSDQNADISPDADNGQDIKIPFRYKGIILDLLEAIEVVSPDAKEKNFLVRLIDGLLSDKEASFEKSSRSPLLQHIADLRQKVIYALNGASQRKKDSLVQSKEPQVKTQNHYHYDQEAVEMVTDLFKAICEVIQADKDHRTGKGIIKDDLASATENKALEIYTCNDLVSKENSKNETCPCCTCQHCYVDEKYSSYWFPTSFSIKFWSSNSPLEGEKLEFEKNCQKCAHEHKVVRSDTSSSWWWPIGGWWSTHPNETGENMQDLNENKVEQLSIGASDNESIVDSSSTPSWIWYPIESSLEIVAWISSLWLTQGI